MRLQAKPGNAVPRMYEALVLVDPQTDISVEQLVSELENFYSSSAKRPSISRSGDLITLAWPGYALEVGRSSLPDVLEESAELARSFAASHPEKSRISCAKTRFELSGDEDPDMDYFNDFLFVIEALQRLGNVYHFDPGAGEFT
jgi:hypothetical protein